MTFTMQPRSLRLYLVDALNASRGILAHIAEVDLDEYLENEQLRSYVERQLTIICEAIIQARRLDPTIEEGITDVSRIIALRNILVHHYFKVRNEVIYEIAAVNTLVLIEDLVEILGPITDTEGDW